jgi:hypothetical protein
MPELIFTHISHVQKFGAISESGEYWVIYPKPSLSQTRQFFLTPASPSLMFPNSDFYVIEKKPGQIQRTIVRIGREIATTALLNNMHSIFHAFYVTSQLADRLDKRFYYFMIGSLPSVRLVVKIEGTY